MLRERLAENLDVINKHLHTRTYLVGHRITVADIVLASLLLKVFAGPVGAEERARIPNVVRHFETVYNQPKAKSIFGEFTYADKAVQFVPPAKEKKEPKEAKGPVASVVAAVKEKLAPKPKETQPEDDDDEPAVAEEPKAKNPLDSLPKSTLNLEDWKRAYSNLDTRGPKGSLEWFYEQ